MGSALTQAANEAALQTLGCVMRGRRQLHSHVGALLAPTEMAGTSVAHTATPDELAVQSVKAHGGMARGGRGSPTGSGQLGTQKPREHTVEQLELASWAAAVVPGSGAHVVPSALLPIEHEKAVSQRATCSNS